MLLVTGKNAQPRKDLTIALSIQKMLLDSPKWYYNHGIRLHLGLVNWCSPLQLLITGAACQECRGTTASMAVVPQFCIFSTYY